MAFTVEFQEEHTFPRSTWTNGIFVGTRQLICAWSDRVTLLTELATWPNNKWPYPDGASTCLADRVASEGIGAQTNAPATRALAEYSQARLTVRYTNAGPAGFDNGATLVSEYLRSSTEVQRLDEEQFRWDSNNGATLKYGEAPVLIHDELIYVVTFHQALAIPSATLTKIGTCNSNAVATWLLGLTFAAQTLKYQGATTQATFALGTGHQTYNVTYYYRFRPVGWNVFWRQTTAQYEPLYVKDGLQFKPYPAVAY